jgi:hypothetical protein
MVAIYLVNIHKTFYGWDMMKCVAIYLICILVLALLPLFCVRFLDKDRIANVMTKTPAETTFVPIYLGYFFIALSVTEIKVFVFVMTLLLFFILHSQHLYFNIIWMVFGYRYYEINHEGTQYLIITKRQDWKDKSAQLMLRRINNYTFIEGE